MGKREKLSLISFLFSKDDIVHQFVLIQVLSALIFREFFFSWNKRQMRPD